DETPQCDKHEEAQQPPAESEVYTGCGRPGNLFHYVSDGTSKRKCLWWGEHLRAAPAPVPVPVPKINEKSLSINRLCYAITKKMFPLNTGNIFVLFSIHIF